ncbi:uncharacterized protein LOC131675115 [Phymastichus coffea]|uniref:uncharacterized protein LOC131675115 n=1 Tax=Phymastichus coffea TaxID=108790 RepID=UPI00273C40CC|nr:uncharacterized protein LOC131675115 [Phymastichus coffea]
MNKPPATPLANSTMFNGSNTATFIERTDVAKLAPLTVPKFDGNHKNWVPWKANFQALIHDRPGMAGSVKLSQLQNAVQGLAATVIKEFCLDPSDVSYGLAWEALCNAYDQRRVLVNEHFDALLKLAPVQNPTAETTATLMYTVRQHVSMLKTMNIAICDEIVLRILEKCLPGYLQSRWMDKHSNREIPKLEELYIFVQDSIFKQRAIDELPKRDYQSKRKGAGSKAEPPAKVSKNIANTLVTTSTTSSNACVQCGQSHRLYKCEKFNQAKLNERWELVPNETFPREKFNIPKNIKLADPQFHIPRPVDVLLASGPTLSSLAIGQIRLNDERSQITLQKTSFGWIAAGGSILSTIPNSVSCNAVRLDSLLERFMAMEDMDYQPIKSEEDVACERYYVQTTTRDASGRYIVRLPFRSGKFELGLSKHQALQRFQALQRKFDANSSFRAEYEKEFNGYLELGHMTLCEDDNNDGYYLPHHAVIKESSETTKCRVVFDASAKSSTGISLNDMLLTGPTIQETLWEQVLRFRSHPFVITADIEKMYRQIWIHPDDRKFQKILWYHEGEVRTFVLNVVTFGVKCAPFLAIRTLHQLAVNEESRFPRVAMLLRRDFYVDDFLSGADTLEDIMKIRDEMIKLLSRGGFVIRKWSSNHPSALDNIDKNIFDLDCGIQGNPIKKTLGIIWDSQRDVFTYSANPDALASTKRKLLSQIARIFDRLGLLGPLTLYAKTLIQDCWKANITWDESLPQDIHTKWIALAEQLPLVRELALPRYLRYDVTNPISTEIHGFCDASIKGYGACIYIRSVDSVGNVTVRLACSKAPHLLRTYEANRVADIQALGEKVEWKHVRSKDNPADSLSRGQLPRELLTDPLWLSGPPWLVLPEDQWPSSEEPSLVDPLGAKEGIVLFTTSSGSNIYSCFSDYGCLIRSIGYLLRWSRRKSLPDDTQIASKSQRGIRYLSQAEIVYAELQILLLIQRECFSSEIRLLKSTTKLISKCPNGAFRSRTKFDELNSFLDEYGLIRVGGRLKNLNLQFNQKYPILLPSNHHVSDLIIRDAHHRNLHGGVQSTLYRIRERFWILNGRNQIRYVLRHCVPCLRQKPKFSHAKMADLPESRVNPAFPFAKTGVDFFGPIMIKEKKDRNRSFLKAYGSVFVCMATKAVHIEVASDLSAEGFLACFRRFVATHGKPTTMYSDNGTNFVGANSELQRIYQLHDSPEFKDAIQTFAAAERIEWNFNPPLSPHFGGLWEAAVKSFKHHLNRVIKDQKLTYEQLETLLKEIAVVLNSRPLYAISADPNDSLAITPAHFLIGRSFNFLLDQNYVSVPDNRLTSYQLVSKARQAFWSKWHKEYLHELQTRQKWLTSGTALSIGSVVVSMEDNPACARWPLGVVVEIHPGSDGIARVASVKMASGIYKRNITRLCVLPVDQENADPLESQVTLPNS